MRAWCLPLVGLALAVGSTLHAADAPSPRSFPRTTDFFPTAVKALTAQDWAEIASALSPHKDPLFSDVTEARFDVLRDHIMELEREAEAERH